MVEGSGFAGRREERLRAERLRKFIEDKDRIIAIPDTVLNKTPKKIKKKSLKTPLKHF